MSTYSEHVDQALAIVADPRPDAGMTSKAFGEQAREAMRGLLAEAQRGSAWRIRLQQVWYLHEPVPDPAGGRKPRCGCCAEPYPCRTVEAIIGGEG